MCVCVCLSVRSQTPLSSRHESGPSLFLSTGKHPVGGQLPRFFSLLCLGRAATVQTYHPTKNFRFSVSFRQYSESTLRSMQWTREAKIDRSTSKRSSKKLQRAAITASFSTGPWSSCIVTGHDRLMTVTSQRTMPAPSACQ